MSRIDLEIMLLQRLGVIDIFFDINIFPLSKKRKRDERYLCVEVFSQELEELH
jgi:hypothetical protein